MKRIIKGFDQYVKESLDDDQISQVDNRSDDIDEISMDEYEEESRPLVDEYEEDLPLEEESYQYIGSKLMNELAEKLGTVVINNEIEYDGKKINYFSETECFHIDDKKFETIDEAFEYLTQGE